MTFPHLHAYELFYSRLVVYSVRAELKPTILKGLQKGQRNSNFHIKIFSL